MSEFTQFDSVKSMIRYLPPNGTAGFARSWERIERRSPSPPARITAIVRFTLRMLARAFETGHHRTVVIAFVRPARTTVGRPARGAPRLLQEEPRVDEVSVEHDRPVKVRPGRVTGVPFIADQLAAGDVTARVDPARIARLHVRVPGLETL